MKGYLATNFFSKFALDGTESLAQKLEKETPLKWYVPHRNGEINDKKNNDDIITDVKIYQADAKELMSSNIIVANLDGVEIDSGVAGEIGMIAAYDEMLNNYDIDELEELDYKLIIGCYTDMRQYGTGDNHYYINLFVKGACNCYGSVVDNEEDIIRIINNWYKIMNAIANDDEEIEFLYRYGNFEDSPIAKVKAYLFNISHESEKPDKDPQFLVHCFNLDSKEARDYRFKDIVEVL